MATRIPLIAGNWKMHGSLASCEALATAIIEGKHELRVPGGSEQPETLEELEQPEEMEETPKAEMLLCPPPVYLEFVGRCLAGSPIHLGAQNLAEFTDSGAYTGEVSGRMLKDLGCDFVIVGHSERRALFGEDDKMVSAKFSAAQAQGLTPILCVGELLGDREAGRTEEVVGRQVESVLSSAGIDAFADAVVAYEPVWAIGTGHTATPRQAQDVHAFIRGLIASQSDIIAAELRILYGGSVKGSNARELLAMDDIDGGLVGGASLDARGFLEIFEAATA